MVQTEFFSCDCAFPKTQRRANFEGHLGDVVVANVRQNGFRKSLFFRGGKKGSGGDFSEIWGSIWGSIFQLCVTILLFFRGVFFLLFLYAFGGGSAGGFGLS